MAALITMKRPAYLRAAGALVLALASNACEKQETKPAAAAPAPAAPVPAVAESKPKAPEAPKAQEQPKAKEEMQHPSTAATDRIFSTTAVETNGFGSDEPVARKDEPTRGVVHVGPSELKRMTGAHWEQYDYVNFNAKRWGRYEVRITYTLKHTAAGTQFRFSQTQLKKSLLAASQPKVAVYGELYIEKPGTYPFVLYVDSSRGDPGFSLIDVAFVPAPEGPAPKQAADGSLVLEAGSATTWSENMRYEPKAEKNCLGFWTSEEDLAEWSFEVAKPGRYKVTVVHGCGTGNEGSEVAVKLGGQELKFTVKDTGGFQKWSEVPVGEVEIKSAGKQHLVIDPVTKAKSAVLDVHKILLTPVS